MPPATVAASEAADSPGSDGLPPAPLVPLGLLVPRVSGAAGSDGPAGSAGDDPRPPSRALQLALAVPTRQRPDVRRGLPIGAYSDDQLDELVAWLQSDEQERTREQLAAALRDELGITRRSYRIDTAVRSAITRGMR